MDTATIAAKLVAHCRNHTETEGLRELYGERAESVAASPGPSGTRIAHGREAIEAKHDMWAEQFERHGSEVDGPYLHDSTFAVIFTIDATERASGNRVRTREIALYHVADGKIVKEEFFAPAGRDGA